MRCETYVQRNDNEKKPRPRPCEKKTGQCRVFFCILFSFIPSFLPNKINFHLVSSTLNIIRQVDCTFLSFLCCSSTAFNIFSGIRQTKLYLNLYVEKRKTEKEEYFHQRNEKKTIIRYPLSIFSCALLNFFIRVFGVFLQNENRLTHQHQISFLLLIIKETKVREDTYLKRDKEEKKVLMSKYDLCRGNYW